MIPQTSEQPKESARRPAFSAAGVVVIGFLLFVGYAFLGGLVKLHAAPPPTGVHSLEEFRILMDSDNSFRWCSFSKSGRKYYEARKSLPLWTLPSGPSCYVFDDQGRFQDWIVDNGESSTWDVNWGQTGRTESTYAAIVQEIATHRGR